MILLHLDDNGWFVEMDSPDVIELMGTRFMPTGFTAEASWKVVLQRIQEINPDEEVRIAGWYKQEKG